MAGPVVVGLGALNADRVYRVKKVHSDGETAIESAGVYGGGSAANTIYGLARLGIATGFCGAVGGDDTGRMLLADFKKAGTDARCVKVKEGKESGAVLCFSGGASRSLYVLPGANSELAFEEVDLGYVNSARWLYVSSFVDDAQFELSHKVIAALASSVRLGFSPGMLYVERGFKALGPMMRRADIVFFNRRETEELTGKGFEAGADACLKAGCRTVVVTLGQGIAIMNQSVVAYVRHGGGACWIGAGQADNIKAADTTGAGDAFAAGFLFGILSDKDAQTCGELGHTTARLSLRFCGARQGLPTRSQLLKEHASFYEAK